MVNNYPDRNLKPIQIMEHHKDKRGHRYSIYQCPFCCNFLIAREDSINSGNTKSCGCLKIMLASETHKKKNVFTFPLGESYAIGFYNNFDGYFIIDAEDYPAVSKYNWTAQISRNRIEPVTTIKGKKTKLSRFVAHTPDGLDCDHMNGIHADNRKCNLRNCTLLENLHNRDVGQGRVIPYDGKYGISFPNVNTSDMVFESEADALSELYALQDKHYGEFAYRNSQAKAKEFNRNQFNDSFIFYGVLEQINNLPERNVYKYILSNSCRNYLNGIITEDNFAQLLFQLIGDYKAAIAA